MTYYLIIITNKELDDLKFLNDILFKIFHGDYKNTPKIGRNIFKKINNKFIYIIECKKIKEEYYKPYPDKYIETVFESYFLNNLIIYYELITSDHVIYTTFREFLDNVFNIDI